MHAGLAKERRAVIALVLAAALALTVAPSALAKKHMKLYNGLTQHGFEFKPAVVGFTGDGSGFAGGPSHNAPHDFGKIHWKKWGKHKAVGRATYWLNDCKPDCADGKFHGHRGPIRAGDGRHHRYHSLKLSYRVHGHRYHQKLRLKHAGGSVYWG